MNISAKLYFAKWLLLIVDLFRWFIVDGNWPRVHRHVRSFTAYPMKYAHVFDVLFACYYVMDSRETAWYVYPYTSGLFHGYCPRVSEVTPQDMGSTVGRKVGA